MPDELNQPEPETPETKPQEAPEKEPQRLIVFKRHTGDYAVECPSCGVEFTASTTEEPKDEPVVKPCPDCGKDYDHANLDQCPNCHRWTGR